jgi:hypothetical protein
MLSLVLSAAKGAAKHLCALAREKLINKILGKMSDM